LESERLRALDNRRLSTIQKDHLKDNSSNNKQCDHFFILIRAIRGPVVLHNKSKDYFG
jgi:hypothetical protein